VTTPLEQRPTIEWHEKVMPLAAPPAASPTPPTSGAPAGGASVSGSLSIGGGQK
jgi:hypothetical protein